MFWNTRQPKHFWVRSLWRPSPEQFPTVTTAGWQEKKGDRAQARQTAGVEGRGFRACREEFPVFPCLYQARFCAYCRPENELMKIAQTWIAAARRATKNSGIIIVVSGCTGTLYWRRAMRVKALGVFILAFCAAALPVWGQDQNSPPGEPAAQPQPADSAPVAPQEPPQAAQAEPGRIAPPTLTLPAGALLAVRVNQWLSSDRNHPGDTFSAMLDQPLVVQGWVVARRGQMVLGRVDVAQKASQGKGVSQLGLAITELTLVDGEQVPVNTEMQQAAPSPAPPGSAERNVGTIGTTTVLGTIAGAAISGGQGAAIGAGVGATAGLAAVLYTRARP